MSTGNDQGSGDQLRDDAYELDRKSVAAILYAVDVQDKDQLTRLMEPLHAADIAVENVGVEMCELYRNSARTPEI